MEPVSERVLLIGGPSGAGKTMVARQIGERLGRSWLQVDDLRLALQRSRVQLPERTSELYFFLETPDVWRLPPERLRDGLIAVGELVSPAIEVVVVNHVDTVAPAVIEGDGIVPSLLDRPVLQERALKGQVGAVFLEEQDEGVLLANMLARGRGAEAMTLEELRNEAHVKWLFGQWLVHEARDRGLPVVAARPWETLADRIGVALERWRDGKGSWAVAATSATYDAKP